MDHERLSSALGWMSIACWIVVYSPQIWENYTLKSGEGLSVFFVGIWLLGDLCNLSGALMAGLIPTVIILAVYYSLCDIILLSQIYYYRSTHPVHLAAPGVFVSDIENNEQTPLLENCTESITAKSKTSHKKQVAVYMLLLVFVLSAGMIAWLISGQSHDNPEEGERKDVIEWKSQVIGWTSATLYLGSRIPQILKNFETRCAGLSLALFMFAIAGNVTYVLSICVVSMEKKYLIANASWLAGSGLTVFLDLFVLGQFFYFQSSAVDSVTPAAADRD